MQSEECLERERERVTHYLHSSTEPKLVEVCYDTIIWNESYFYEIIFFWV